MITVGLPVFNGEKFIQKRIENILTQTFEDFILIVSDNYSTDNTQKICASFGDSRIRYFRQESNIGAVNNFKFVLDKAETKYFVWAAVDDIWSDDFLQENISFLESHDDYVGSIAKSSSFGEPQRDIPFLMPVVKKLRWSKYGAEEADGNYNDRITTYLKRNSAQAFYAVYRTWELRNSYITDSFLGVDLAVILNVLRHGNFHVTRNCTITFYRGGSSSKGITGILPYYQFTRWCYHNLERAVFVRNLFHFVKLNMTGEMAIIYNIMIRCGSVRH